MSHCFEPVLVVCVKATLGIDTDTMCWQTDSEKDKAGTNTAGTNKAGTTLAGGNREDLKSNQQPPSHTTVTHTDHVDTRYY